MAHDPTTRGALDDIDHIVVVMMENRSFDNLLGWLYDEEPPRDDQPFDGLHPEMWCPLSNSFQGRPFIEKVYVRKNGETGRGQRWHNVDKAPADYATPNPDPGEGYRATNHQLFGGYDVDPDLTPEPSMTGFVDDYQEAMRFATYQWQAPPGDPRDIMTTYTPDQTTVLSNLAKQYAVSDRWFASVPSQTIPNRDFVHAATSEGRVVNGPNGVCWAPTIFEALDDAPAVAEAGLEPWRVYSGAPAGKPKDREFSLTRLFMARLWESSYDHRFRNITGFVDDARAGDLPAYTFVEPTFVGPGENDQKPPSDIRYGEHFLAEIYNAMRTSPVWDRSLLVIIYDEHGGCFDHTPPPATASPPAMEGTEGAIPSILRRPATAGVGGEQGFRFDRFGVRVPAVFVSPWIEAGTVARPASDGPPFDHTTVIATLRERWGITEPLTGRDAAAPHLGSVLTRETPRDDAVAAVPHPLPAQRDHSHPVHELTAAMVDATVTHFDVVIEVEGRRNLDVGEDLARAYHARFVARTETA